MAELAVPASVAAVISLSIQCCENLHKYYADFRSHSQDIQHFLQEVDDLRTFSRNLELLIQARAQSQDPCTQQVTELIDKLRGNAHKLEEAVRQCHATLLPDDVASKIKATRTRVLYPFKKRTIQSQRETVKGTHAILRGALQLLQL